MRIFLRILMQYIHTALEHTMIIQNYEQIVSGQKCAKLSSSDLQGLKKKEPSSVFQFFNSPGFAESNNHYFRIKIRNVSDKT